MASLCGGQNNQTDEIELGEAQKFTSHSLRAATNNFSRHNLIGGGGFAKIYRGTLPNGTLIAVKKYHCGPRSITKSTSPHTVEVFSCPNVNRVIGYCFDKKHRLLVFKYMSNGSLHDLLDDKERRESVFKWSMRVAVCNGIARGLHHLQQQSKPRVVHDCITASNVLLDSNFTPKITGFDRVKIYDEEEGFDPLVGAACGYFDPEYAMTSMSDVYAFGLVMLEIITGRKALEFVTEWGLDLVAKDMILEAVDPVLADYPIDQALGFLDVALSCINDAWLLRPTMGEVIQMLNRVCGSPLTPFELQQLDTPYLSAASSSRRSMGQWYDVIEAQKSSVELNETTKLQPQEEVFEAPETSATHSNTINVAQQADTGITVSSSGDLVERQSQTTTVFGGRRI